MKNILSMARMNVVLAYRIRIAFFFTTIFPMMFFFVYFSIFAGGKADAVAYLMGPLISLSVISSSMFGLSMQMVTMRERDMLRRYHLAPLTSLEMIGARLLSNYTLFIPVVALQFVLARLLYHMPLHGSLLALLLIYTLGYAALAGIGLIVAGIVNTVQEATVLNQILFFALLFLSGTTVPIASMNAVLRHVALFLPPTLMIVSSEGVLLKGDSLALHLPEVVGLLLTTLTAVGLAVTLFRWEKDQPPAPGARRRALIALVPILIVGFWLNHSSSFLATNRAMFEMSSEPR